MITHFLNKHVLVEIEDCAIPGKLLGFQEGSARFKPHRPNILILETALGKAVLRGNWTAIKTFEVC